jgi:hypothetical protein
MTQTFLGWSSGNAGVGFEQRYAAQPFTLPPGSWHVTEIQPAYFLTGAPPTDIGWIVWTRNGQVAPVQADEIASGTTPYSAAGATIPVNLFLGGGEYYLTIYGIGGAIIGWYTNAQGAQAIPFQDAMGLFMWRSAQYPSPGFQRYTTTAFSPDPGTNVNNFYCAEFIVRGDPAGGSYCTAGTSTGGCTPAIGASGAPSVAASSGFSLSVSGVPGQRNGLIFYGISGQLAAPWGTGTSFLCVKAPLQRMTTQGSGGTSGQCDGTLSEDWLAYLAGHPVALGQPFSAGQVVDAQGWYRDPGAPKNTNLSDAVEWTTLP